MEAPRAPIVKSVKALQPTPGLKGRALPPHQKMAQARDLAEGPSLARMLSCGVSKAHTPKITRQALNATNAQRLAGSTQERRRTMSTEVRFWSKVRQSDDCWEWTGARSTRGYGRFQGWQAHRWAYEHMVAEIPEGLCLDHLCRNRVCVNPYHVEPVPPHVNTLRGESFGAKNARKTHCPHGHPYAGDNLYVASNGNRHCVECRRRRDKAKYQHPTHCER